MAKTKRPPAEDSYDDEPVSRPPERRARSGWFLPRLAVMLVLLGVCAWFAPAIIAGTSLWKTLVAYAAPQWQGKLDAGSVSLGWLSPVVINQAVVRDAQGQPLAQASKISSQKTLLALVRAPSDLGKFTIADATSNVVVRADGSNVEDFLASLPASGGAMPQFELELTGGKVTVKDEVTSRTWQFGQVSARLQWPAAGQRQGALSAAVFEATSADAPPQSGELIADFSWQPENAITPTSASSAGVGSGAAHATVRGLPTESLEPLLRRLGVDVHPVGPLHADVAATWTDGGQQAEIHLHQLRAPQWAITSPRYLAGDRLQLAIASGQGIVSLDNGRLIIRDLNIDSDLVQLRGQGSAGLSSAPALATTPAVATSANDAGAAPSSVALDDLELQGRLDLVRLAAQLPHALRLRDDTRITSGEVLWTLRSRSEGGVHRWEGSVRGENLAAESGGRQIAWQQPIALSAGVSQSADGWRIDELRGDARFLQLQGGGTLREGAITASADLNQLVADLAQIVDWRGLQLSGSLAAEMRWKQDEASAWQASAEARVQNFQFYAPDLMPWREDDLRLSAALTGRVAGNRLEQVSVGGLSIVSGVDQLNAELSAPVDQISSASAWPIRFVVQGDLATWMPRVQAFFPSVTTRPAGAIQLQGSGTFSPQRVELEPTKLDLTDLAIDFAGLSIREPRLQVETSGKLDVAERKLSSTSTTLASTALALRADNVLVSFAPENLIVSGMLDYRGDLERLSGWLASGDEPRLWQVGGSLTGTLEAKYEAGIVHAAWTSDVDKLTYSTYQRPTRRTPLASASATSEPPAWATHWFEPRVTLVAKAQYDPRRAALQLSTAELNSAGAGFTASGTFDDITQACIANVQGEVWYDGVVITEKLRAQARKRGSAVADTLQITGKDQRKFALRGPLLPPGSMSSGAGGQPTGLVNEALVGEAGLGWQEVKYAGLTAGAADFRAALNRGVITIGPLNIPVSEGRISTTPRIALNERYPTLVLDSGKIVNNVRLSPEICHTWLKYVAPLLADATRAEGRFSVDLTGAAVPLTAPEKTDVAGSLLIHQAEIGPGPLAQQYLALARQVRMLVERNLNAAPLIDAEKGLLVLPEQKIDFEVMDGRVHHRGLQMTVKDIVITTHGSVGFDQTIDLVAEIPVQDSWLRDGGPLVGLRGKTISVPIRGDLTQPQLDGKVLEDLGKNMIRSAAQGVIENQLNKGFQRLFGPLQPQTAPPGGNVPVP